MQHGLSLDLIAHRACEDIGRTAGRRNKAIRALKRKGRMRRLTVRLSCHLNARRTKTMMFAMGGSLAARERLD
jgi:hypothetical protein